MELGHSLNLVPSGLSRLSGKCDPGILLSLPPQGSEARQTSLCLHRCCGSEFESSAYAESTILSHLSPRAPVMPTHNASPFTCQPPKACSHICFSSPSDPRTVCPTESQSPVIQLWAGKAAEAEGAGENQSRCDESLGHRGHGWVLRKDDRDGEGQLSSTRRAFGMLPFQGRCRLQQLFWEKWPLD